MNARTGTSATPAHVFNDFKLKVYAPLGFKYLRKKFNLDEADFMHSISETELKEISNPGASGSIFYKTSDDKYILKTVQYQECEFLKTLLAGIYLVNLFIVPGCGIGKIHLISHFNTNRIYFKSKLITNTPYCL